jgi:5'-methylthioadenosine phosphorylase
VIKAGNLANIIPQVKYGLIGGSGTWGARFPEDLGRDDVKVVEIFQQGFETPYGRSIPFKLLKIKDELVLRVAMHGIRYDGSRSTSKSPYVASKQVASVFQQAGVRWALVDASVGGIQSPDGPGAPLPPWSVVITDDFLMLWRPKDDAPFVTQGVRNPRMGEPLCKALRQALFEAASRQSRFAAVHDHGVYACAPWGRFETSVEIKAFADMGAHIVGMTLGHEAPLMRRLGIHFGSLNIVSNYAEGSEEGWIGDSPGAMAAFYHDCAPIVGNVMIDALKKAIEIGPGECNCGNYTLDALHEFPVPGA